MQVQEKKGFWDEFLGDLIRWDLIPEGGPGTRVEYVLNLLTNGLVLLFVAVILIAIVFSALAGIKFIRSQGDADKVKEAQDSIKNVLIGVASVFIGVIGVILITGIFLNDQESQAVRKALCTYLEPDSPVEDCVKGSN